MVWFKTTAFFILALIGLAGSAEAGLRIGVAGDRPHSCFGAPVHRIDLTDPPKDGIGIINPGQSRIVVEGRIDAEIR